MHTGWRCTAWVVISLLGGACDGEDDGLPAASATDGTGTGPSTGSAPPPTQGESTSTGPEDGSTQGPVEDDGESGDDTTGASPADSGDEDGGSTTGAEPPPEPDHRILHCGAGGGNVVLLDLTDGDDYEIVWEWQASEASGLPENLVGAFYSMSDCKMAEGGTQLAIAGHSQVALLDFPSGDVLLHGPVGAAHSVAVLPDDRLVGVGSSSALIRLFEVGKSGEVIWEDTMTSAHGALWDRDRERLYVIGHQSMRLYSLVDWDTANPGLALEETLELPDRGAHDLSPLPGTDALLLSTRANVWTFDRGSGEFAPFAPIADEKKIKSVDVNPTTGRTSYTQGEDSFWGTAIQLLDPAGVVPLPEGERLYKARWFAREGSAPL